MPSEAYVGFHAWVVERYRDLLERYRPDLLPRDTPPDHSVVPFRRPGGNGSRS
jgi:hypothetical protein